MSIVYTPREECVTFWTWLIHEWDVPVEWMHARRYHGLRFFGWEIEWMYIEEDDYYA